MYDYLSFDAVNTVDRMVSEIQKFYTLKKFKTGDQDLTVGYEGMSPILDIFLNDKAQFKNIDEIIKNDKFSKLDIRIKSAFLASKSFLKDRDFSQMSIEGLTEVKEAVAYAKEVYTNQKKMLSKRSEDFD